VYITAHWDGTGEWAGESLQCGWRMGYVPVGAVPDLGAEFTPQVANITDGTMSTGSDATWNWLDAWQAEFGADVWHSAENLAAATAILTYWNAIKSQMHAAFTLSRVKTALIEPDGSYAYPSSIYSLKVPVAGSGTGTTSAPPEVAICTTLRAPVLGRRGRGRWYSPPPAIGSGTNNLGKVLAAWRTTMVNAGKTLVDSFNAIGAPGTDYTPLVAVAAATSSTMIRPTEVRVGDHFDAQRRRQHQVAEVYTSVGL